MSELIELTEEEINAGAMAASIPGGMGFEDRRLLIQAFAWAVNKMRAGDTIGTVRRSIATGTVAVRCQAEGDPFWCVTRANGDTQIYYDSVTAELTNYWPVIYTPEAS